ncbi:AI-2E family transporter [Croceicoccus sediminis]|uniref:AI-2E family transporter n=1 Tax=Croceicoccus sediminis TaxID=2571150 RepID=UPI001182EEE8|nr:AI-2E family transporter [Croceicoccus sediminis]
MADETPDRDETRAQRIERLAGNAAGEEAGARGEGADLDLGRLASALLLMIGLGLFLALPFVLSIGSIVFLPLVTAVVLTILLSPLADRINSIGIPNVIASLLSVVIFIAVLVIAATAILQPAADLFEQVPQMIASIDKSFGQLRGQLDWINDLGKRLGELSGPKSGQEVVVATPSMIERVALATPTVIIETLLTFLMAFFMIEARVRMRHRLLLERTEFGASLKAARALREVQDRVASYILTVGLINLGVGVVAALGAWAIGLDAPIMWGGLAALLNFLPYIGPFAMTAILLLVGMGTADTILMGLVPAAAYLGLHTIEANAVTPAILGARFTMNPVIILIGISYFTWVWGVLGAVLSMPILITLMALFEHLGHPNIIGFLFGEPLFQRRSEDDEAAA